MELINNKNIPPVILLAFANDYQKGGSYLRNLELERDEIFEALKSAEHDQLCQIKIINNATLDKIINAFRDKNLRNRITIFHFAGHADEYTINLEGPAKEKKDIYANGFADFLGMQRNLELVFLNACSTKNQSELLHAAGIPTAISTNSKIDDATARKFAVHFYKALNSERTISDSYREVNGILIAEGVPTAVRGTVARKEENTTKIIPWHYSLHPNVPTAGEWSFIEAVDNPLAFLPKLPAHSFPMPPFPGLHPYTNKMAVVFGGRAHQIRRLYKMLVAQKNQPTTLLYGASGVGKTSLLKGGLIPRLNEVHLVTYLNYNNVDFILSLEQLIKKTSSKEFHIIIIDEINGLDANIVNIISEKINNASSKIRFLLSISTHDRLAWEDKISHVPFHLGPLRARDIKDIIQNMNQSNLFNIDADFAEPFAALLTKDEKAPVAPILQWCLSELWRKAKSIKNDEPNLSWPLFQKYSKKDFWSNFIIQQLKKVNNEAFENGLLLNILKDCLLIESNNHATYNLDVLSKKYAHLSVITINHFLVLLKKHYLLSSPATDKLQDITSVRVAHNLLREPLLQLIEASNRPGQHAKRLIIQDTLLDKTQIKFLKENLHTIPNLSIEEQELLSSSESHLKNLRNRKIGVLTFQIITVVIILGMGYIFGNPYLLLYLILLLILYK